MQFLLMHRTVAEHDAISYDILEINRLLCRSHQVQLFCEHFARLDGISQIDANAAMSLLAGDLCFPIYYHSTYWPEGERLLSLTNGRIVFKYHNITPPSYFAQVPDYWQACIAGREQTYRFVRQYPKAMWLTDSLFNLRELGLDAGVFHRVVPPFVGASGSGGSALDEAVLRELLTDKRIHLLFVGRIAPHKGHLFLLDVVYRYRQFYGKDVILHIIGKRDEACRRYAEAILAKIAELGLSDSVEMLGEVDASRLVSYFLGSDAYLCCSEHEGFCAPIVEAQSLHLPVVAFASSAIPETIGRGQILLGDDAGAYAHALHRLRADEKFRQLTIQNGRRNYMERFTYERTAQTYLSALGDMGLAV
jgi:glycosyltransferase involved in cell wall biosynthesis